MKEADVQRQILDYLKAEHRFAMRVNTGAFVLEANGKQRLFRSHSLGPGAADILVPASGSLWIECKNEKGKQTIAQKGFEQMVEELGHLYVLARSIDDLRRLGE